MKKFFYIAVPFTLALLQVNTSEAFSSANNNNRQQLQVAQGFQGDVMAGKGGVGQSVSQTSNNSSSASTGLDLSASFGGLGLGGAGAANTGMAGLGGLGSMFGSKPAATPAEKPAISKTPISRPENELD